MDADGQHGVLLVTSAFVQTQFCTGNKFFRRNFTGVKEQDSSVVMSYSAAMARWKSNKRFNKYA